MSAQPPHSEAWQIGKTAASIRFVKDAESWIIANPNENAGFVLEFMKQIRDVKEGKIIFNDFVDISTFWSK